MSEPSQGDTIYFRAGSTTYFGKFERAVQVKKRPYYEVLSQGLLIKIPKSEVVDSNHPRERNDFL